MVLGQPVGDIERRGSLAKPGRRLRGRVPHLGPQDELPPNSEWAGPTIPARWDDRQRYSYAYGDTDTHDLRHGLLRHQAPAQRQRRDTDSQACHSVALAKAGDR